MSTYVHHVPGRLRLQSERLKGDRRAAVLARRRMAAEPGVQEAEVNPLTGSLTILYDRHRTAPARLWRALRLQGLVDGDLPPFERNGALRTRLAAARAASACDPLIEMLYGMLLDKLIERSALALVGAIL